MSIGSDILFIVVASVVNLEAVMTSGSGVISVGMASTAGAGGNGEVCESNLFWTFLKISFSIEQESIFASYLILAALLSLLFTFTLLGLSIHFSFLSLLDFLAQPYRSRIDLVQEIPPEEQIMIRMTEIATEALKAMITTLIEAGWSLKI